MKDMHTILRTHAWGPEMSPLIVANVLQRVERHMCTIEGITLIFPECGSGYHEWEVVHALNARGHHIHTLVLMDSSVMSECAQAWHELSQTHKVDVVSLNSYVALEQWVQKMRPRQTIQVIYINGMLRFSPIHCGQLNSDICMKSAIRFWDWCDQFATNRLPLNFVRESVCCLAGCKTWGDLACTFSN